MILPIALGTSVLQQLLTSQHTDLQRVLTIQLFRSHAKQHLSWSGQALWPLKLAQRLPNFLRQALLILLAEPFHHALERSSPLLHERLKRGKLETDRDGLDRDLVKASLPEDLLKVRWVR